MISISSEKLIIYREIFKKENPSNSFVIKKGVPTLWDNRFHISSELYDAKCELIDEKKWLKIKKKFSIKKSKINFTILKSLPLIRIKKVSLIPFLSDKMIFRENKIDFYFCPKNSLTKKNFFRY